jgi:hypothetical protein
VDFQGLSLMKYLIICIGVLSTVIIFFVVMDYIFYAQYETKAKNIKAEAGRYDSSIIGDNDLRHLPAPVARYMRACGLVGMKRINSMRLIHTGTFKAGVDKEFMPIKGEYYLTTKKPSFCWYGKMSIMPGVTASAIDTYFDGNGSMVVKVLSFLNIVNTQSKETMYSAFGRCIAEMTMVPSFFLDTARVHWTSADSLRADCVVSDAGLSTKAALYFNLDGMLDKIVVERYYDRGNNQATLEKFTGTASYVRNYSGLKIGSVYDGYWNLKEGDLHYVHFIVEKVDYE